MALTWKSKGRYTSKLRPLFTAFLHSIKPSRYSMGIKFDKDSVAVEQNNYTTKPVNAYIFYEWPKILFNILKLKSCLFRLTNIVKSSGKEK